MRRPFRDPRRVAALALLGGVFGLALRAYPERHAKADPSALGPSTWSTLDTRVMDPAVVRRALIRYAMLCDPARAGVAASGPLLAYANNGILLGSFATIVACAIGAPEGASCADLQACTGHQPGAPPPAAPACSGVYAVSPVSAGPPGAGQKVRATQSCLSQGGRCFQGSESAFCAGEACAPGETYACDGSKLVLCTEGVRLETPCPLGTACGASPGSGVLGCNGTGVACEDDASHCQGSKRTACLRDGFGKGRLSETDCGAFGLSCFARGSGQSESAVCNLDVAPGCSTEGTAWTCEGGLVKACVAGRVYSYACADLGMAGICKQGPTGLMCTP